MPTIKLLCGAGSFGNLLYTLYPDLFANKHDLWVLDSTLNDNYFPLNDRYFRELSCLENKISDLAREDISFCIAIGNHFGFERTIIYSRLCEMGLTCHKLFNSSARLLSADIHDSVIVMPGVTIMPGVVIDKCSIVNTSATIDHDVVVSEGCHIMGSSYIAGRVKIGRYSTIGSNATIFPDIAIGENCFIGAGSVVNRNVEDNKVVVGNPAAYLCENRDLSSIFIL